MTPKIATCCYCGTRAALTLRGRERHELSCSSCGAPLHEMKMLRADAMGARDLVGPSSVRQRRAEPARPSRRKKKSKSLSRRFMSEVWDVAEDIFDIFD